MNVLIPTTILNCMPYILYDEVGCLGVTKLTKRGEAKAPGSCFIFSCGVLMRSV